MIFYWINNFNLSMPLVSFTKFNGYVKWIIWIRSFWNHILQGKTYCIFAQYLHIVCKKFPNLTCNNTFFADSSNNNNLSIKAHTWAIIYLWTSHNNSQQFLRNYNWRVPNHLPNKNVYKNMKKSYYDYEKYSFLCSTKYKL